jgi:hypothetical protein
MRPVENRIEVIKRDFDNIYALLAEFIIILSQNHYESPIFELASDSIDVIIDFTTIERNLSQQYDYREFLNIDLWKVKISDWIQTKSFENTEGLFIELHLFGRTENDIAIVIKEHDLLAASGSTVRINWRAQNKNLGLEGQVLKIIKPFTQKEINDLAGTFVNKIINIESDIIANRYEPLVIEKAFEDFDFEFMFVDSSEVISNIDRIPIDSLKIKRRVSEVDRSDKVSKVISEWLLQNRTKKVNEEKKFSCPFLNGMLYVKYLPR